MAQFKRQQKECLGCGNTFLTLKNYDYCANCAINGSRYTSKKSPCSECDGSGVIKFPGVKPRPCKLCYLKANMKSKIAKKKLTAEEQEEKFWTEVNLLAQEKIYQLLTNNIPFQNIKLITEHWKFEERQQKLTGLFLDRDVDYRTLLGDIENQSETSDKEYLAEEIAVWYLRMVMKSLISDLSDYSGYDPSLFEGLTNNEN